MAKPDFLTQAREALVASEIEFPLYRERLENVVAKALQDAYEVGYVAGSDSVMELLGDHSCSENCCGVRTDDPDA